MTRRAAFLLSFAMTGALATDGGPGLSPEDARTQLSRLIGAEESGRGAARASILRSGDRSLIPHLVDAVFFAPKEARGDVVACLEGLAGEKLGTHYRYWVEWLGGHSEIRPKDGYRAWKAALFSRIDPAFATFLDPAQPMEIRPEEIVWGGVKKDGIPALQSPATISAAAATFLSEEEMVFGVSFRGESRAYPQRILDWHEMVNDRVGGQAFALSYCTLCGSAVAFATSLSDGQAMVFGSSGLLYRSNKLMYDEGTLSLWSNLTGEPVSGPLAGRGVSLPVLPVTVTRWGDWRARHPETTVVSLRTGHNRDYTPGAAYGKYFESPDTMFPVWKKDARLDPKAWIYALRAGGAARAYPLDILFRERLVNDFVGSVPVVLLADPASGAVRAYRRERRLLAEGAAPADVVEPATGASWRLEEEALVPLSPSVPPMTRYAGHRAYWFGWHAFFPDGTLYEGCTLGSLEGR